MKVSEARIQLHATTLLALGLTVLTVDMRASGNAAVDVLRDFLSNDYMLAKCFYLQSLLINGLLSERPNMLPDFSLQ